LSRSIIAQTYTSCRERDTHQPHQMETDQQQTLDPKFLPFIRTDRYGEGGWNLSFWATARLLLLACTLLPLRLISCLACVASFYVTCRLAAFIPNELVARRIVTACGKLWSRACLFCLGFVYIRWTRPGMTKQQAKAAKRRSGMLCAV
jgi:hypothetical protein